MLKKINIFIGIFFFLVAVNATVLAQSTGKIDITLKKRTIKELISTIEKKTDYTFLYSDIDVDAPVDIDVAGKSVQEILDIAFGPYGISYEIKDKRIILKKAAAGTDVNSITADNPAHNNNPFLFTIPSLKKETISFNHFLI